MRTHLHRVVIGFGIGVSIFLAAPSSLFADEQLTRWPIDKENPDANLPDRAQADADPLQYAYLLMELSERADFARQAGDHATAIKYYGALAKAVPERSISFSRMCQSYEALGDRERALQSCRQALGKEGVTVNDYARFVRLILRSKSALSSREIEDIDAVITHLKSNESTQVAAYHLLCEVGLRLQDEARLEECTAALTAFAPHDPKTISFRWALAMQQGSYDNARGLIEEAKQTHMEREGVERMERATLAAQARSARSLLSTVVDDWWLISITVLLLGLLTLLFRRKRWTPRSA